MLRCQFQWLESYRASLAQALADVLGQKKPDDATISFLATLDYDLIHAAVARQTNLQSNYYRKIFPPAWRENRLDALEGLAGGIYGPGGWDSSDQAVQVNEIPAPIADETPRNILDQPLCHSHGRATDTRRIEYGFIPHLRCWLPVAVEVRREGRLLHAPFLLRWILPRA